MEYYILKLYKNEKQKCPDVEQGFNKFDPDIRRYIIICLIVMIVSLLETFLSVVFFPERLWYVFGIVLCIIAVFMLVWIENRDEKNHLEKYVDSHKKKIQILDSVLSSSLQINSKEKVEELIDVYHTYIEKKSEEERKRNRIIVSLLSILSSVLIVSFTNMGLIGVDFAGWLFLAILFSICIAVSCIWVYSFTYTDSLKKEYEIMIKDLTDLLLIKY